MFQQAVQSMNRHLHWKRFKKVSLNYPFEATEWDWTVSLQLIPYTTANCQYIALDTQTFVFDGLIWRYKAMCV